MIEDDASAVGRDQAGDHVDERRLARARDAEQRGDAASGLEAHVPMVYVSHHAGELKRIATSVVLLDGGRVAAAGGLEVLDAATAELMA